MLFQIKGKILDRDRIGKLFLVDFGYTKIVKISHFDFHYFYRYKILDREYYPFERRGNE